MAPSGKKTRMQLDKPAYYQLRYELVLPSADLFVYFFPGFAQPLDGGGGKSNRDVESAVHVIVFVAV